MEHEAEVRVGNAERAKERLAALGNQAVNHEQQLVRGGLRGFSERLRRVIEEHGLRGTFFPERHQSLRTHAMICRARARSFGDSGNRRGHFGAGNASSRYSTMAVDSEKEKKSLCSSIGTRAVSDRPRYSPDR